MASKELIPGVKMPSRKSLFDTGGEPMGYCFKCKKLFPVQELKKIYTENAERKLICVKCLYKIKLRKSYTG